MSTLGDLLKKMASVKAASVLMGASQEFAVNYNARIQGLAETICQENNMTREQAADLPQETPLGARSQLLYGELLGWLSTQHSIFKE